MVVLARDIQVTIMIDEAVSAVTAAGACGGHGSGPHDSFVVDAASLADFGTVGGRGTRHILQPVRSGIVGLFWILAIGRSRSAKSQRL